jgi:3-deoxy-D-manno-octulosonate 8-phosphate phosphatase (KDO 8-P phosphatase)
MNIKQLLNNVKAFAFDVDGVLTDGKVLIMPDGEQLRQMNIKDGYALQLAIKKGYNIAIITGGKSESIRKRLNGLGITDVYLTVSDKEDALEDFKAKYDLKDNEILYMGDDMPDICVLRKVGVPTAPNDACHEVKEISLYISSLKGGEGCVRDIVEQVLKLHNNWEIAESPHL